MCDIVQISAHCAAELNAHQAKSEYVERSLICAKNSRESACTTLASDSSALLEREPILQELAGSAHSSQLSISAARAHHHQLKSQLQKHATDLSTHSQRISEAKERLGGEFGAISALSDSVKDLQALQLLEATCAARIQSVLKSSVEKRARDEWREVQGISHNVCSLLAKLMKDVLEKQRDSQKTTSANLADETLTLRTQGGELWSEVKRRWAALESLGTEVTAASSLALAGELQLHRTSFKRQMEEDHADVAAARLRRRIAEFEASMAAFSSATCLAQERAVHMGVCVASSQHAVARARSSTEMLNDEVERMERELAGMAARAQERVHSAKITKLGTARCRVLAALRLITTKEEWLGGRRSLSTSLVEDGSRRLLFTFEGIRTTAVANFQSNVASLAVREYGDRVGILHSQCGDGMLSQLEQLYAAHSAQRSAHAEQQRAQQQAMKEGVQMLEREEDLSRRSIELDTRAGRSAILAEVDAFLRQALRSMSVASAAKRAPPCPPDVPPNKRRRESARKPAANVVTADIFADDWV